ncbi:MAG: hypothetical protein L0H74_04720 [Brachybacterium sp.]|nr:hypothetical protein [Brachybacterium sp.]
MRSESATGSRPSTIKRPSAVAHAVVVFLAGFCANLAVGEWVSGSWRYYVFWQVPVVLSAALAVVFACILALTRVFTGPRFALWTPAVLGVLASLVLIVGVFTGSSSGDEPMQEVSWLTVSYLALPPLMAALWFEGWETVRLREARSAARAGDGAAAR